MKGTDGTLKAVMTGPDGKIRALAEFAKGPGSMLGNPAILTGVAGIMAQMAMQQAMAEITDYLAAIDQKVDDILQAQKDSVVAGIVGVGLEIEEAMAIRDQVGEVSEVTWSKVQATSTQIKQTQVYAMRQIQTITEKLERNVAIQDLVAVTRDAQVKVHEWLAILARCFQLQEALGILELDRVFVTAPRELEQHRIGLRIARQRSRDDIVAATEHLITRMDAAVASANDAVLFHPFSSPAVVESRNHVVGGVCEFWTRLGIKSEYADADSRRWDEAVVEVRDRALEAGAGGLTMAAKLGNAAIGQVGDLFQRFLPKQDEHLNNELAGSNENPSDMEQYTQTSDD
ncbi:MAG: hypothetical protein LBV06_10625 [Propionibacteriaceae bacterium]|jgi:hypothetical protein|nr:hypothetical protein [Propionibacteriaceae bacterium]